MSYNKEYLFNKEVRKNAMKLWLNKKISDEQQLKVQELFPVKFYSPGIFVRIGLFIFTLISTTAAFGLFGMVLMDLFQSDFSTGILMLLASAIILFALQHFIKNKHHYGSGLDDYLLYQAVIFVVAGLILIFNMSDPFYISVVALPLLVFSAWRYHDSFLALCSFICFYIAIFFFVTDFTSLSVLFLPFIFCGLSVLIAVIAHKILANDASVYWDRSIKVIKIAAFISIYLSINYFVVREGNRELNSINVYDEPTPEMLALKNKISENDKVLDEYYSGSEHRIADEQVMIIESNNSELYSELDKLYMAEQSRLSKIALPAGMIFLILTFIIPVVYIVFGLLKKDRILLICGLLLVAATVLTFRYYYSVIALENALAISGIIMLLTAWISIRYLKKNSGFLTFEEDVVADKSGLRNLEALAAIQTFGHTSTQDDSIKFGEGKFGGGGAGGGY